jgi:hypothetical protein
MKRFALPTYVTLGVLLLVAAVVGGGLSARHWSASSAAPALQEDVHFTGTITELHEDQHVQFWVVEVEQQFSGPPITEATVYVYSRNFFHPKYFYSWLCEGSLEVEHMWWVVGMMVEVLGVYEPPADVYPCEPDHYMREWTPAPSPTPTPSPTPSPTATATPTPTPSPTPSPTASPTPDGTRTLVWGPGWHNVTWTGTSTPEEAFACAAGNYAAAYRLVGGGWERYFPDRPDLSNMTHLGQYDPFLILVTGDVDCEMPVADPPGTERTLDWGVGWQNDGWTGADGTAPQDAFACADGSYAAAYRLVGGGWERYFPDRPELSNMGPLNEYDAFLILVTAPVSCDMAVGP